MKSICTYAILSCGLLALPVAAQELPDGPGKEETARLCKGCHELARSISLRQDRDAWAVTVRKMVSLGVRGTDSELELLTTYLAKNYPAGEVPPVRVNQARAIDFESRLGMRRSQAAAIIRYRTENGPFKSFDDLKKVPGVDIALLEEKKDRLAF